MTYQELETALTILGLGERATLAELKARYHQLAQHHHPDRKSSADGEQMHRINAAYSLLRDYCSDYSFNFSEDEFYQQDPEARLRRQFATDPVWGGLKEES